MELFKIIIGTIFGVLVLIPLAFIFATFLFVIIAPLFVLVLPFYILSLLFILFCKVFNIEYKKEGK